jgi:hypothetical protein
MCCITLRSTHLIITSKVSSAAVGDIMVCFIRDLPVALMLLCCAGLCSRGKLRRQNEKAHLIGHVKDVGVDSKHENPATRIYLTSVAQPWHVDGVDVVGESPGVVRCSIFSLLRRRGMTHAGC